MWKSHILNLVADNIYNMYYEAQTVKDLWRALAEKYKIEKSTAKKYAVGRYLNLMTSPFFLKYMTYRQLSMKLLRKRLELMNGSKWPLLLKNYHPLRRIYKKPFGTREMIIPWIAFSAT